MYMCLYNIRRKYCCTRMAEIHAEFWGHFDMMLTVYTWTWRMLCAWKIITWKISLAAAFLFTVDLCDIHCNLRSNFRRFCSRCALFYVMLMTIVPSNFNLQAETALGKNCSHISNSILVRIPIYIFTAFALCSKDFVEWHWDFSTRHIVLSD